MNDSSSHDRREEVEAETAPSESKANGGSPRVPAGAEGEAPSVDRGKYVYCIVETSQALDIGPLGIGEGENRVYTIHHGELAAVVSDTPVKLYDPTRENLLAHESINETVMKEHTVIPMSFGTIFRTEEDVVELLRSTGRAFQDVLDKIRGKIELGLKVLWDRDKVVERIEEENAEISGLRKEIAEASSGSTYLARMQLGRLMEGALEARANEYASDIYKGLKPVSVASRSGKLIGESMILNASFLVDRSDEDAFDREVRELSDRHDGVLSFKYTGPWPPYNFVNIKLTLERAGD